MGGRKDQMEGQRIKLGLALELRLGFVAEECHVLSACRLMLKGKSGCNARVHPHTARKMKDDKTHNPLWH